MRFYDNGSLYSVSVSPAEMRAFADRWPCSGMRNPSRGMWFQFDRRNGDLVDIQGERESYDNAAVAALSEDAQKWAQQFVTCTNCGGPLPEGHGVTSRDRKHYFCDACAGLLEALAIGNPKTQAAFLYDDGKGNAVAWTGGVLGQIVHKRLPIATHRYLDPRDPRGPAIRRFAPVRYRVRMLDGSLWHGSGPTANGNYIRLRRMKGDI
jgi:hypothetical protein